jgi:hypothetical protein
MDAMLTLYILCGCVALAVLLFVVMGVASVLRRPQLPDLDAVMQAGPMRQFLRALTPRPLPLPASIVALAPSPAQSDRAQTDRDLVPRTVIPLPAIVGIAPATRSRAQLQMMSLDQALAVPREAEHLPIMPNTAIQPMQPMPQPAPRLRTVPKATRPPPVATEEPPHLPTVVVAPALLEPVQPVERAIAWAPPPPTATIRPAMPADFWTTDPAVANQRRSARALPQYPDRPSVLGRILGWTIATLLVAAAPAVVEPALLDPLCDDYEWDGAETAAIARDVAREAHAAIDLAPAARAR